MRKNWNGHILWVGTVNLKKECICQKGLFMVNSAQIPNQSLEAQLLTEASHAHYISGKSHRLSCQASYTVFLLSYTYPYKGVPGIIFLPMG